MLKTIACIGIRREDKSVWERRVALTPNNVKTILQRNSNIRVIVQPSQTRIFNDKEYKENGAEINEDLTQCKLIIGVKEVGINFLLPNKAYMFFSHVIKGQPYNMPLLDAVLEKKITLFDYEKITDEHDKRLVAFGEFAGIAGAIDFLSGLGLLLIKRQISTPFLNIDVSYKYLNLDDAKEDLKNVGEKIKKEKIPNELIPLVFAVTGTGYYNYKIYVFYCHFLKFTIINFIFNFLLFNLQFFIFSFFFSGRCSTGAFQILNLLPVKMVDPDDLKALFDDKENPAHQTTIYLTNIVQKHMVESFESPTKKFDKDDYYNHPTKYNPIFHERYLPYISAIFNCMYWDTKFPRLITNEQMKFLVENKQNRLLGVSDITCDIQGSINFLVKSTTLDSPFYTYNPITETILDGVHGFDNGILFQAVDYLPAELAFDSSTHFGSKLLPFIENLAFADNSLEPKKQGLLPEMERAMISWNGKLTEKFSYIWRLREAHDKLKQIKSYSPKKIKEAKSFHALHLKGQLFQSQAINKIVDLVTIHSDVKFNFESWNIGPYKSNTPSSVVLQLFGNDQKDVDNVLVAINKIAEENYIDINDE